MPSVTSENILQQVQLYNDTSMALLENTTAILSMVNTKLKDFQNLRGNLGASTQIELPSRFTTVNSLVLSPQAVEQRFATLTVNQQASTSFPFTAEQFVYGAEEYINSFGRSAIANLGSQMETNISKLAETSPYRFFGDGYTPFSSFLQIAQALTRFRNFGAASHQMKCILPDFLFPAVANSGQNQFVTDRNEQLAKTWMIGSFGGCEFYSSNLLPLHEAGTEGTQGSVLTVVSTTRDADGAIIAITFSGTNAANDPNSIKIHDRFQFNDGVSGFKNTRFRTWTAYAPSISPVQFKSTSNVMSSATNTVVVNLDIPLQATAGINQNITQDILPGMQVSVMPSCYNGLLVAGDPLYVGMPDMPSQSPFASANTRDPQTGIAMQMYHGVQIGQNSRVIAYNQIWGQVLPPEYGMSFLVPAQ